MPGLTPPDRRQSVSHLKNGRLVVVPHRGHGVIGAEGCVAKIRAVPFVVPAAQ